jgi:hypothetical protein
VRRGNYRGATLSLERGLGRLRPLTPVCQGVCVDDLVTRADRALLALIRLGPARIQGFDLELIPQIGVQSNADT